MEFKKSSSFFKYISTSNANTINIFLFFDIFLFASNPLMAFLLRTMGIMRSNMEVLPWMCLAAVLLASAVSFFIIWLLSGRIGKISAYSLITE